MWWGGKKRKREQWQVKRENEEGAVTEFWNEPCILARIPVVFLGIRINNHQILWQPSLWSSSLYVNSWCHLTTGCLLLTALAFMTHREVIVKVTQSCLTLCDPMDSSRPGSSAHAILQARILEWVAVPFSRGSSQPKAGRFFTSWATRET